MMLPSRGVEEVVVEELVGAEDDQAAVARGRGDRRGGVGVAVQGDVHGHAADGGADGVVVERGDDHGDPLLAGRLVAGDAGDPELALDADGVEDGVIHVVAVVIAERESGAGRVLGVHAAAEAGGGPRCAAGAAGVEELDDQRLARLGDGLAVGQERPGQGALERQRDRRLDLGSEGGDARDRERADGVLPDRAIVPRRA